MTVQGADNSTGGVLSNSRWNLVAFGAGLAAQFLTVPLVVRWIGLDAFGAAAVVLALCAPLSLVGTVLGQALIRELASRNKADQAPASMQAFTSVAMRWCMVACMAGWCILAVFGPAMARLLISDAATTGLGPALLIGATGAVAQQVGLVLQSVSAAKQDYKTIARMALYTALAGSTVTLGITWMWPQAQGYLAGVAAGFVLVAAVWFWRWRSMLCWRTVFSSRAREASAALLRFSRWQGVAQLAGVLGNQIDRYALGAMTPVSVVGQYTVANRLQEAAYIGVIKAGEVLFPRFGTMSSDSFADRLAFFQLASWGLGTISAALLVPLAVLASSVLSLWVGAEVAKGADHMLFVLVLGGVVGSATNVFTYYAMGMGRNKPVAGVSVLFSALTVISTILLVAVFGVAAAGAGLLLASVARVLASMVLTKRLFFTDLEWSALLVSTALPLLVGCGLAALFRSFFQLHADGWTQLAIMYGGLSLVVGLTCLLVTGVTSTGRGIIVRFARSIRRDQP
ncbi:lipopolysaccharide biosynthesis protein [Hydrogenophaga crocea]|uniref:Oligosaccharide flippase family protein n=1 Tax=Hydrogenophaga crocea TaxID=2716225 RepID=A0A6G8IL97_9BURK|nr:oligosaccharide flippase family protein [Hydrogenophaga crocea]QIM53987.1 oligosaccharide flippase family protein [Hydrogenophaga crocea]